MNEIMNKMRMKKNQENPAHRFEDKYLSNHLVKIFQDRRILSNFKSLCNLC